MAASGPDITGFRAVTAALGFLLIAKLLYEYFSGSPRVSRHPDSRVRRLNKWRVYSCLLAFGSIAVATPAYRAGLPVLGVFILFGIAIGAGLIFLVCTFRVVLITRHL